MKSIPAASAILARRRQSGQLADQRSGTVVAERPEEQLAPNSPIFRALSLYIAARSRMEPKASSIVFPPGGRFLRPMIRPARRPVNLQAEPSGVGLDRRARLLHEALIHDVAQCHFAGRPAAG